MKAIFLKADDFLADDARVVHGFFTRRGGASQGIYQGLNCGYGSSDDQACVDDNRRRVAEAIHMQGPVLTVHQVHSADCITVHDASDVMPAPKLDAMVTAQTGVILGILTADCGPVLFHGERQDGSPVIGAAHAGWGGAVSGVLENTMRAMMELGADGASIHACIGPCIGPLSYEVSYGVPGGFERPFLAHDRRSAQFFNKDARAGHALFDLPGYIRFRLEQAGLRFVTTLARDTCAEEQDFFSYRRACLRGEGDYGRQLSVIAIR
jgi:YfiH family protein